jgi:hypothetical protein
LVQALLGGLLIARCYSDLEGFNLLNSGLNFVHVLGSLQLRVEVIGAAVDAFGGARVRDKLSHGGLICSVEIDS